MCNAYSRSTFERAIDRAEEGLREAEKFDWSDVNQAPFVLGSVEGHLKTLIQIARQHLEDSDVG